MHDPPTPPLVVMCWWPCVWQPEVVRSKVQTITPTKASRWLQLNTANRPTSKPVVHSFAEVMRRGDWKVTHQGIAFDTNGVLVDGQHRLAAVVEADAAVDMTVFTSVPADTFDVLDTGKRRNAADALAIEGEKSTPVLASMLRTVWLYHHRPDATWSGRTATVTNRQILDTLHEHPGVREYVVLGERTATETGMIKSAAAAASYLVDHANPQADLDPWWEGLLEGAGLTRDDPRLRFRNTMLRMAREQASRTQRRRNTREHVALYLKAFNAWATGNSLHQLRYTAREPLPPIATVTRS